MEQNVSDELEQLMEDKEIYTSKDNSDISVPITRNDKKDKKYNSQIIPGGIQEKLEIPCTYFQLKETHFSYASKLHVK